MTTAKIANLGLICNLATANVTDLNLAVGLYSAPEVHEQTVQEG